MAEGRSRLLAFRNCIETKEEALARLARHRALDHFVDGVDLGRGKPCSIFCMVEPFDEGMESSFETAERVHGIPQGVSVLQYRISEGLPDDRAMLWLSAFYEAVPEGADLSFAVRRFLHWALTDKAILQGADAEGRAAIANIAGLYGRMFQGDEVSRAEWWQASRAANDAWLEKSIRTGKANAAAKNSQAAENAALVAYHGGGGVFEEIALKSVFDVCTRGRGVRARQFHAAAADVLLRIVVAPRD